MNKLERILIFISLLSLTIGLAISLHREIMRDDKIKELERKIEKLENEYNSGV